MAARNFLELVADCDNFPYESTATESLYSLHIPGSQKAHGYLLPSTVSQIPWTSDFTIGHINLTVTPNINPSDNPTSAINAAFAKQINTLISSSMYPLINKHSEPFPILGSPHPNIHLERFASALFGIPTQGAHMTAFVRDAATQELKIWVPRRSAHLRTWPGQLDTTVAGGVAAGESPYENVVREAGEEASLPAELLRRDVRSVGVLTYMGYAAGSRLVISDVIYCYDLELSAETVPKPGDDEVEAFHLMNVEDVKKALLRREFKANCALVMLDFFIRHGIVTNDDEPDFVEVVQRMHRRLPFDVRASSIAE